MKVFDVIVIGVGGMGSAALYHLAKRGVAVLGIEQYGITHDRGSSHGQTRVLRRAYFEDPAYVPLLNHAYKLWADLESEASQELVCQNGLFLAGRANTDLITGVRRVAAQYDLAIETVQPSDLHRRFPGFAVDDDMEVLFEADAGFLRVEGCVRAHCDQATGCGAEILTNEVVQNWMCDRTSITVTTNKGRYVASKLVICAGPWAPRLLQSLALPLEVRRSVTFWLETTNRAHTLEGGCPVFGFETLSGFFYGFPALDPSGMKVAEYAGKELVDDPDNLDRELHDDDFILVNAFLKRHLPTLSTRINTYSVCMYTMTPDKHFIIDRHYDYPDVVYAAGFSGHGFKFAPVVGSVLADLCTTGQTSEPIQFLESSRRSLVT